MRITYKTRKGPPRTKWQTKDSSILKKEEEAARGRGEEVVQKSAEVHICLISESNTPGGRGNIPCNNSLLGCVGGDLERKRLASKSCKCLVGSSPVVGHAYPPCFGPLHPHSRYVSSSSDVHHIHQQPVPISLEGESKPTSPLAWHSTWNTWSNEKRDFFLRYIYKFWGGSFTHTNYYHFCIVSNILIFAMFFLNLPLAYWNCNVFFYDPK